MLVVFFTFQRKRMLHPLEVCEFDPVLIDGITNKLQDTKALMVQLCINKMILKLDDAKEVFNDEDFVNKVRFFIQKGNSFN